MTPSDPVNEMADEDMRGFIGLPDYQAEVTVSQCDLMALPEGVESAATKIEPSVRRPGDQFLRWTYVADEPQRIRETWVGWMREAEAQQVPPQVLAVSVYSHRVDWHTEEPMILVYDAGRGCYRIVT